MNESCRKFKEKFRIFLTNLCVWVCDQRLRHPSLEEVQILQLLDGDHVRSFLAQLERALQATFDRNLRDQIHLPSKIV